MIHQIVVWSCFAAIASCAAILEAISAYSRSKLERYCLERKSHVLGRILDEDDDVVLALRGWLRLLLLGLVMAVFWSSWPGPTLETTWVWPWLGRLAIIWLLLVFVENWVARPIGEAFAEPIVYWSWGVMSFLRWSTLPASWVARRMDGFWEWLTRTTDSSTTALHDEILTVVNEGEREGQILGDAAEMIAGLMALPEVEASSIMTPRPDIVTFPIHMTIEEARIAVAESGHSRIPVYAQNRDDVVGILYAKDLLPHLGRPGFENADLSTLHLRPAVYVPENKRVHVLLREFRKGGVHIAIVLDSYGGVAGLVTIEDIIEEIVGDIKDEYDEEEVPPIRRIADHVSEVDARLDIESINDELSLGLPEDQDYDTLGGFVSTTLGRIPKLGETFEFRNLRFTVTDGTDRSIDRLRIEQLGDLPVADSAP